MNQAITAALEAMLASKTPGLDRGGQGMPQLTEDYIKLLQ